MSKMVLSILVSLKKNLGKHHSSASPQSGVTLLGVLVLTMTVGIAIILGFQRVSNSLRAVGILRSPDERIIVDVIRRQMSCRETIRRTNCRSTEPIAIFKIDAMRNVGVLIPKSGRKFGSVKVVAKCVGDVGAEGFQLGSVKSGKILAKNEPYLCEGSMIPDWDRFDTFEHVFPNKYAHQSSSTCGGRSNFDYPRSKYALCMLAGHGLDYATYSACSVSPSSSSWHVYIAACHVDNQRCHVRCYYAR